jgi:hypothetical protein
MGITGLGLWTATPSRADASWLSQALHREFDPDYGYYGPAYSYPPAYSYGSYYDDPYYAPTVPYTYYEPGYTYYYEPGWSYAPYRSYYRPYYKRYGGYYKGYRSRRYGWGRGHRGYRYGHHHH